MVLIIFTYIFLIINVISIFVSFSILNLISIFLLILSMKVPRYSGFEIGEDEIVYELNSANIILFIMGFALTISKF